MDWAKKWLVDFNAGKTHLVLFHWSQNTGSIDVKMDGSVLKEKSSFKMLGLTFSSKLDWGSYIISIAKTASKKIGALICSMNFLSPEVALYLYKSTICPCIENNCHIWVGALVATWLVKQATKMNMQDCLFFTLCFSWTLGSSLKCGHLKYFLYVFLYFSSCSLELALLVPLLFLMGRSTQYSNRLHDFSVTIPRCYKNLCQQLLSSHN